MTTTNTSSATTRGLTGRRIWFGRPAKVAIDTTRDKAEIWIVGRGNDIVIPLTTTQIDDLIVILRKYRDGEWEQW